MQLTITLTCTSLDEAETLSNALDLYVGMEEGRLEDQRLIIADERKRGAGVAGLDREYKRDMAKLEHARRMLTTLQGPSVKGGA